MNLIFDILLSEFDKSIENDFNILVRLKFDVLTLTLLQCYSRFGPGEIYY